MKKRLQKVSTLADKVVNSDRRVNVRRRVSGSSPHIYAGVGHGQVLLFISSKPLLACRECGGLNIL
jgi:hypothetical protein